MKNVDTALNDEEYARLLAILERTKMTKYSFFKEALLKELRAFETKEPALPNPIVQQMIEGVSGRKRFIYQMGPYSDENHRDWLAGRFPQATKREVIEAVAAFRAAGGKT